MNNVKQGYTAGQSTRKVVNKAVAVSADASQTVATTVGGFFKGFFANPDQPVATKAKRTATKRK